MSTPPEERKLWIYVEDALIVLAIAVLWLTIFKLEGEFCRWIQFVTFVVMVVILIRRINRIRRATETETEEEEKKENGAKEK